MKTFYNILFTLFLYVLVISCSDYKPADHNAPSFKDDLKVNFIDFALDSTIGKYVTLNAVDPKQKVLSLNVYRDPFRHIYYLTQIRRKKTYLKAPIRTISLSMISNF
jgi:hypothetical protein